MKRIIVLLFVIMAVVFYGCDGGKLTEDDLTNSDRALIDCVYDNMSIWEYNITKNGTTLSIQKLSFYRFAPGESMCFYVSWSSPTEKSDLGYAKYYGNVYSAGYFIFGDEIEQIGDFSIYEYESNTRHEGYIARVSYDGSPWDTSANDEVKYDMIVDAYLEYLNK